MLITVYNMEYVSRSIVIVCTIIATVLIPSTKGTTIFAFQGDNKVIKWTLDPIPQPTVVVNILHPFGYALYSALGNVIIKPGITDRGRRVSNTGNTDTVTGHIEFTLNDITEEDAGSYKAHYNIIGGQTIIQVGVTLVVNVKPSTPNITVKSPPAVGGNMTLNCVTQSNSKPDNHESLQMTYIWYRNGADLPSEDRYVTSGSQLEVKNIQRTDRDTVYSCKAYENVTLTSVVSTGYTVVVEYGPGTVLPDEGQQHSLAENIDNLGPITCNADCVPACTYQWKVNGTDHGSQGDTLRIPKIPRFLTGTYWCVASNKYGTERSKYVTVTVLYGPKITNVLPSKSSYTRVEVTNNKLGSINCIAECNPRCNYQWFRDGQVVSTSAILTLTGIARSDRGTYLCRAYNDHGGMNSTSFDLFVEYGPDPIVLSPETVTYTLLEDSKLDAITCTSSCNPECSYVWKRNGNQVSNGNSLSTIDNIKRGQAGHYVCTVTNKHGNRQSNVQVVVQYAPDKPILSINTNMAAENSPLSFECTAESFPPSNMIIYRENQTILSTAANTTNSNYTIPHANCLDTGLFYCSAANIIGKSTSEGTNANVLCKPRPDHRVSLILKQALGGGESMNISGTLISNPPPTIYWSLRLSGSAMAYNLTNNRDNFMFYNIPKRPSVSSTAVRTNLDINDFGEYVMNAYNDYGLSTMVFTVTPKRKPDEPTLMTILCKSRTPVQITFSPNFDGGDTQYFVLGMRSATDEVFKIVGDELVDNKRNVITISGPVIDAGTVYVFMIIASNAYGTTQSSSNLNCSIGIHTDILPDSQTCEDLYLSGIVMLVIGSVTLLASNGLVIIWLRYRKKRARKNLACTQCGFQKLIPSSGSANTNAERNSQTYEDVGQLSGRRIEMTVSHDASYEELGVRSLPSVYGRLSRNRTRQVRPADQYPETRIN